jgi:tetratricopeptide (TPR) repeat protein
VKRRSRHGEGRGLITLAGAFAALLCPLSAASSQAGLEARLADGNGPTNHQLSARSPAGREALDVDPLALTDEMKAFATKRAGGAGTRLHRLTALQDAIFDADDGLGITYGSDLTFTAAETFTERSGNCLSFTLMFSSLARHVGLVTHFVEVDEVTGWSRRGDVDLSHGHMYVEVETEAGVVSVDFLPWSNTRYRNRQRISEQRVTAHYHNNIGADLLTADRLERAVERFRLALLLDPGFLPARVNLAVAYRRSGSTDDAEALLLYVLERDRENSAAASNLAALYLATGREKEANTWLERRKKFLARNPFHHFRLGVRAMAADRPLEARSHLRRAIRRQSDEGIFYEKLAEAHIRLDNPRKARRALRKALELTSDPDDRWQIEDRIQELGQPSAGRR